LDSGECSSAADLARKLGVSRARVSQVLNLLRLSPEVLDRIAALGDPVPGRGVTERKLRPIVELLPLEQKRWVKIGMQSSP